MSMKPVKRLKVQPPKLPKLLPLGGAQGIEDHAEIASLELANIDFSGRVAQDILFEQVRFRKLVFTRSRLTRVRVSDFAISNAIFH